MMIFSAFFAKNPLTFLCMSVIIVEACKAYKLYTKEEPPVKNQTYRMTMLFDFYGELLTERQKEFFDLYYNEDLSLAEIAENNGITRQGVRDVIVRAEGVMQEIEDKTGLIRRFMAMKGDLDKIEQAAEELRKINYRQYENPDIDKHLARIGEAVAALKE